MKISLSDGREEAIIDDADLDLVSKHTWWISSGGYAYTTIARKTVAMHRMLLSVSNGIEVDHINRNPLDNSRSNLRLCNRAQNSWNKKSHKPNKNGFRGVRSYSTKKRGTIFFAEVDYFGGTLISPHRRSAAVEAARDYDSLATEFHGEFALLNFPVSS